MPCGSALMAASANPVGLGLVTSLARPGGNVTGFSNDQEETVGKRLQLLKTVVPGARRIAVLFNPTSLAWASGWPLLEAPASALGLELVRAPVRVDAVSAVSARPGGMLDHMKPGARVSERWSPGRCATVKMQAFIREPPRIR